MNPQSKDPPNPSNRQPQGNPTPQNPPQQQYPNPSSPQPGQQYQPQHPPSGGGDPGYAPPQTPPQQYAPQHPPVGGGDPGYAPPQAPPQQYPPQGQHPPPGQNPQQPDPYGQRPPETPPGQQPPQSDPYGQPPPQTAPPQTPYGQQPQPPYTQPTPPTSEPQPCKGVPPPADPGCYPPKTPSEEECKPADPCEEWYQTHNCEDEDKRSCKCPDRPQDKNGENKFAALEGTTIRQRLTAIDTIVNDNPKNAPADAIKKLGDDLKELEKEYDGLAELITTFETDRAKIECDFTTKGRKWYEEVHKLCDTNLNCDVTLQDIQAAYDRGKKEEHDVCCKYIHKHYEVTGFENCQIQAERREAEAKSDLEVLKTLSKTFTTRLTDLENIFKDAVAAAEKRRFKKVCALKLEFDGVWYTLFQAETWCFRRKDCCICCPRCDLLPNTLPCWTVERYRNEVQKALTALIETKYNRYLWNVYSLEQQAEYTRLQTACEKARTRRRARFLAEAEEARDCPPETPTTPNTGDYGCGQPQKGVTNA